MGKWCNYKSEKYLIKLEHPEPDVLFCCLFKKERKKDEREKLNKACLVLT